MNKKDLRSSNLYVKEDQQRIIPIPRRELSGEPYRTPWRRDYARLLHSPAFRRLQGKTQLFPSHESDFFRNRLTHSLEVAQIAKSIALKINKEIPEFSSSPIDCDLVEFASLAHDLGHPPFGHNGELALDECMLDSGGFEGNAQTLRILTKIEKRETFLNGDDGFIPFSEGNDLRAGLNLSLRSIASIIKYDAEIPKRATDRNKQGHKPFKGYYYTESDVVKKVRQSLFINNSTTLKTIECSIMDIADDIAYSTYDLEDALKARFLTPLSIVNIPKDIVGMVAKKVQERINRYHPRSKAANAAFNEVDVYRNVLGLMWPIFKEPVELLSWTETQRLTEDPASYAPLVSTLADKTSANIASDGYHRTKFTSDLVGRFMSGIRVNVNDKNLSLTQVSFDYKTFCEVEVLKNLTYYSLIMSPMLKVVEYRGRDIVKRLFHALNENDGHLLLPEDHRELYNSTGDLDVRKRIVCDFIAGMTDRYAIQFYNRLTGSSPESIYSPL